MAAHALRGFNPIPRFVRDWNTRHMTKKLMQYGLCYHDILVETETLERAVSRLPEELKEARMRRITRAVDLSVKKMYLPEEKWEDPWREFEEVEAILQETQREMDERAALSDQYWFTLIGDKPWYGYDTSEAWFWGSAIEGDTKPADTPKLDRA